MDTMSPDAAEVARQATSDSLWARCVATTPAFVCLVGAGGRLLAFNAALEEATGWSTAEVAGRLFVDVLVVPHEVEPATDCVRRALSTGEVAPQEGDWLDRWGGQRRVSMLMSVVRDDAGRPEVLTIVGFDVTLQRQAEATLRERARTDVLTGLANRATLDAALRAELDGPGSCGVLFCDLDGFKRANDTHGHEVGDLILREVARRLLDVTTPEDVVGRFGGDEFVVLLRDADAYRVADVTAALERSFDEPFATPHGLVRVGMSVGAAVGASGDDPDQLVAAADRHMYGVKTARRVVGSDR
ncbi:GGDEF domain-containing protein [Actinotalea ferrariae]|uniref:GGDEF domain-containing protein n=1 Tax=Actinotalea ferrariae TaxID=1386098 RepID=UPI001ECB271A|nr:diguanylate cyclase [Actinotalea ferrariae]MBX9246080.1 GGDEF domain-containing protein [Actinotalea ferrariae]